MTTSPAESRPTPTAQAAAQVGLEPALTAAVALAQIAGLPRTCEQLMAVKRDLLRARATGESQSDAAGRDPVGR